MCGIVGEVGIFIKENIFVCLVGLKNEKCKIEVLFVFQLFVLGINDCGVYEVFWYECFIIDFRIDGEKKIGYCVLV